MSKNRYMVVTDDSEHVTLYEEGGVKGHIASRSDHAHDINGQGDFVHFLSPPYDVYPTLFVHKEDQESYNHVLRFLRSGHNDPFPPTIRFYPRTGIYLTNKNGFTLDREEGGGFLQLVLTTFYDADLTDNDCLLYTANVRFNNHDELEAMLQRWQGEAEGTDLEALLTEDFIDHVMTTIVMGGKPDLFRELFSVKLAES